MLKTKADYARHKGVSRQTVYDWIARGALVLVGTRIDVDASEQKLKARSSVSPWNDPDKKVNISPRVAQVSPGEDFSDIKTSLSPYRHRTPQT